MDNQVEIRIHKNYLVSRNLMTIFKIKILLPNSCEICIGIYCFKWSRLIK